MAYSNRRHNDALRQLDDAWEEMHAERVANGGDSDRYRRLRQATVDARRRLRCAARRAPRRGGAA
jgi:hypothetical protein